MAKTWRGRHEFANSRAIPIIYLVFRDGAIYFAVMAFANLANILTFYFCDRIVTAFYERGIIHICERVRISLYKSFMLGPTHFDNSISVTMMARLMLNLHETADAGIYSTTRTNYTDTNMECYSPTTEVELDTLWSGDLQYSTIARAQSFHLNDSAQLASFTLQPPPA
ncbi:hypothetical protein D9615_005690 [Tricholomella constricta]|uniref:Uncharacterized protein n=1 Tax=Tricholomella constricta TaxID=117010 RepID=A0A8H5HAG0_9AGAR|nr:hypothetical protein D9615_005690 [Tricholomella constricta]